MYVYVYVYVYCLCDVYIYMCVYMTSVGWWHTPYLILLVVSGTYNTNTTALVLHTKHAYTQHSLICCS